jgi:anaerobic ribonucleoside-triphosphate reductase
VNYVEQKAEVKVKTEIYSRVSGYFRPVSQWHTGKQSEFKDRKTISLEQINKIVGG